MKSNLIIKLVKICCVISTLTMVKFAYADTREFTFYYGKGVNKFSLRNAGLYCNCGITITNGNSYTKVTFSGQWKANMQLFAPYNDNNTAPINTIEVMPTGSKFDIISYFYVDINDNTDHDGKFTLSNQDDAAHTWWIGDYLDGLSRRSNTGYSRTECLNYTGAGGNYYFVANNDYSVTVNSGYCEDNGY